MKHTLWHRYLGENVDIVDEKRIGIVGIGHGAYNALRMLSYDKGGVVSCTAAINPITDWMNYGKILIIYFAFLL